MINPLILDVVIDTNIIVSAAVSEYGNPATIFEMLLWGELRNFISEEILYEVKEVLHRPKFTGKVNIFKINAMTENFESLSFRVIPTERINQILEDHDDNKFLECAVAANVNYIISGDDHLLKLQHFRGIKIVGPAEFVQLMNRLRG